LTKVNVLVSLILFFLFVLEEIFDVFQALLKFVREPDGAGLVAREVGGDAEDDSVVLKS
jgi:hypothetical protein